MPRTRNIDIRDGGRPGKGEDIRLRLWNILFDDSEASEVRMGGAGAWRCLRGYYCTTPKPPTSPSRLLWSCGCVESYPVPSRADAELLRQLSRY
jgi:hypothetical protein